MTTDKDPQDTVITLLTDNWNNSNTDSVTPTFKKIYKQSKEMDLREGDLVLVYNPSTNFSLLGLGDDPFAKVDELVNIDVRVWNYDLDDSHARKVKVEIQRIVFSNRNQPDSNFQELNPFQQWQDLSDKMRKIFRYVLPIRLIDHCRDMTA